MLFLYNIGIRIYHFLILLAAPFNKKASLWVEGRKNYFSVLQAKLNKRTGPVAWFHCASLGEFEQTRTLIERTKKEYPHYTILLTFYSPSGYEIRRDYDKADFVFYLPIDTSYNARKFVRVVNPRIAMFAKYEFWYHFLTELHRNKVPVISFSAIFRPNQIFFKSYGSFFTSMLTKFKMLFVQDQRSAELLKTIQINHAMVAGDTRFDRVKEICDHKKSLPLVEKFKEGKKMMVAGSTWPQDISVLKTVVNDPSLELKWIIAPHELSETQLTEIEKTIQRKTIRYSSLTETNAASFDVLIIDNIGMLSSLYQYGTFAYIGGAFGKGLHNILEAATFGMPVFFGPNYGKFREAVELVQAGCGFPVKDGGALSIKLRSLLDNETERTKISERSKLYVQKNTGATDKIFNYCKSFME